MKLIRSVTCNIRKTEKYIYSTEVREYLVTRYRVRYNPWSLGCSVFNTSEEAQEYLTRELRSAWGHKSGWVEPYETTETESLHHRYKREGR